MKQMFLTPAVARRRGLTILSTCVVALSLLSTDPTTAIFLVMRVTTKESWMVGNCVEYPLQ